MGIPLVRLGKSDLEDCMYRGGRSFSGVACDTDMAGWRWKGDCDRSERGEKSSCSTPYD